MASPDPILTARYVQRLINQKQARLIMRLQLLIAVQLLPVYAALAILFFR